MTAVLVPPWRVALVHPAVRSATLLVAVAPTFVAWDAGPWDVTTRLRVAGLALACVAAMVWDDRCAVVSASTPIGTPAVRLGRGALVLGLLLVAWLLAGATASGDGVAYAAISLQTAGLALLVSAVVAALARGRESERVAALPVPVLLGLLVLLTRLPAELSLLGAEPGGLGWPDEQVRWTWVGAIAAALAVYAGRDVARR